MTLAAVQGTDEQLIAPPYLMRISATQHVSAQASSDWGQVQTV